MIDKPLDDEQDEDQETGETVELEDDDVSVEDTDDGGAIVRLSNANDLEEKKEHFANIIDEVDQSELRAAVNDLLDKIDKDKEAREKRDKLYEEGLRRTGLGDDAPGGAQFTGANKVVHPLLVEACVDFSARMMKEVFPPTGPVKSKIIGKVDKEKQEKARKKADFMNWQVTEQMPEFRGELEQLSTQLPLGGAQYLKLMWNPQYRRPSAEFIPIDDVYLPFAATNFYTAERKTHVQYVTSMEYNRRVESGMYIDVDVGSPGDLDFSKASVANDKIEGRKDTSYNEDGLRTIFEVYTNLEFDEGVAPYIISIDKASGKALSLYRNWDQGDDMKRALDWVVEFPFIPWRGAYPIGLTHMIGGLSGAATGALRALLDSAHIQNVPTMLKLKGGPNGQTINIQPTEVVEIEGGAMVDDVRKIAMPLPFNAPSPVLFQLLGFLIDAGKGVVQTSFEKLSDQNPNQPVGTTLALIEQGMVVFSSIHSRIHGAMERTFKILHRINSAYLTEEDIKAQAGDFEVNPADFDGPMDIIPVSDPAIFSETQRFAQIQAIMQRAQAMPQMYDARKVEEMFLRTMKVPDDILVPVPGQTDSDPVSENVAATLGQAVYVLPKQDHMAHIKAHLAFLQSPMFGKNPVIMRTFLFPMVQHLRDHLLQHYLIQVHTAVQKAEDENRIEVDPQEEVDVIMHVQQQIERQLQGFEQMLPQIAQEAQQFAPQPPAPPDSSMQVAQLNTQAAQQMAQQKLQSDQMRNQQMMQIQQAKMQQEMQFKQIDLQQRMQLEQAKLQIEQAKLQQGTQAQQMEAQLAMQEQLRNLQAQQQLEQFKQAQENQRTTETNQVREQMNAADNDTAMRLASAEILSGEKIAFSTGTGINPGTR